MYRHTQNAGFHITQIFACFTRRPSKSCIWIF